MKEYKFKINGSEYAVSIDSVEGKKAEVTVNGTSYSVEMENGAPEAPQAAATAPVASAPEVNGKAPEAAPAEKPAGKGKQVTSPLPGIILEVSVKVGDSVKAGQKVAVIEAMKMENEIQAEKDGTITEINVSKGDSVLEGAPIVTIA
ncbi:MAG: biotin/lipoyl-binding protein [Bacteroidales bacterium]|jgi:biotin carboxyl carrier protein|nr:biotin/lipoyl-binding protein [Bacteroidales bacterium]MCI1785763.1 biotin/lipoyl-binding protein [Bacteroidales bacterium]